MSRLAADVDAFAGPVFVSAMFTIIGGDGREYGPVSADQIRNWINSGRANLDTQAKVLGSEEWRRLADYAEFAPPGSLPPVMGPPLTGQPVAAGETDLALASLGQRFGAALIDGVLKMLCWLPTASALWAVLGDQIRSGEQPSTAELMVAMEGVLSKSLPFLAVLAVVQCLLLSRRGQSIGKALLGLRIVRLANNHQAGFLHAFVLRGMIPWVIEQIPFLGGLFWLIDVSFIFGAERRCLHDYIATTKVVKI